MMCTVKHIFCKIARSYSDKISTNRMNIKSPSDLKVRFLESALFRFPYIHALFKRLQEYTLIKILFTFFLLLA